MSTSVTSRAPLALLLLACLAGAGQAQEPPTDPTVTAATGATGVQGLQLAVFINDVNTDFVGTFEQLPDGSLTAKPGELEEVGIKPLKAAIKPNGSIHLNDLPGVEYHVVPETQSIYVVATDAARVPRKIDLDGERSEREHPKPTSSTGAVLNYTLYSSSNDLTDKDIEPFQGVSGGFDARFFSPFGTVKQSFTGNLSDGELQGFKRLDTTWYYSDPERMITYSAGDFVTRSLPWTRSVHLGGMQVERNFALRSDLVTLPMPVVSGSAAVPSTLEVYTQNVKTFSSDIPAGPFQLANLPVVTGSGEAQVVIRDTLGRETRTTLPFYTSSEQLAKGLMDFSAELGFPRRNFGSQSDDYASDVFGTATMRYGLTNWLTLEGHAEGGADLLNGGIGAAFPLGRWGATSAAVAGSQHDGQTGMLLNGSLELRYDDFSLYGRMQRAFGNYDDIASVTADNQRIDYFVPGARIYSARTARAVDQVSLSLPTLFSRSNIYLSLTQIETDMGEKTRTASASYSTSLWKNASFYASAFKDLDDGDNFGVYAGLSVSFDNDIYGSTGVDQNGKDIAGFAEVSKSATREEGSYGWNVRTSEGKTANRSVGGNYRSKYARVDGWVQQYGEAVRASGSLDGAIAVAGGGVFATNRIDDAFAVVDVGAANVEVRSRNNVVGHTNSSGRLIVPDLNSWDPNQIDIDPQNLPVDAAIRDTRTIVVPANNGGVVVDFNVKEAAAAALVGLTDAGGKPLAAGLLGRIDGTDATFVVGYDGEAYIEGLSGNNNVTVEFVNGQTCLAAFAYKRQPGTQVAIRDVVCQ
ncbi:fimbria/pilus outer membrane usher protein [Phyllobacterium endophyticum]|uniref:Fimbrial assembly protein n=1 Tax=Phyllobacterium endophyticum TaxID=1149773 RepID=A0A2P7AUF2_9HYPH|nr:fimbria/pilus outer membrane usher protein [Phyllobacterium endophyticum]MBB3234317.1 outer membrane usher protein [Phyllobacterium endophyticum]PSH57848.1 fimbrial assembly protein [Phyllobacterium endophyticum]TYR44055.1 fimbrial biogenesis outer membrane usher protein [Phyllobacterium endophyticum]